MHALALAFSCSFIAVSLEFAQDPATARLPDIFFIPSSVTVYLDNTDELCCLCYHVGLDASLSKRILKLSA